MDENEENDSDLEVLDSGALRASYFRQQLRLIYELDQCGKRIPRHYQDFEAFIKKNIEWHPSAYLIHSTWVKLNCAEEQGKGVDVVEISDEDSSAEISNDDLRIDSSVVAKKKSLDKNVKTPEKGHSCSQNISNNFEVVKIDLSEGVSISEVPMNNNSVKVASDKKNARKRRSSVPKRRKSSVNESSSNKVLKKQKKSSSVTMTEAEAETLREQLLIDKIIELELPKVIKSVMCENTEVQNELPKVVRNVMKRTRKRRSQV